MTDELKKADEIWPFKRARAAIDAEVRQAIEMALKALQKADKMSGYPNNKKAITSLRTALAEQPVRQEPVALLTTDEKAELLDWVSACQSAYAMEDSPRWPFRPLPNQLRDNRQGVVDYVNAILESRTAPEAASGVTGETK